MLISQIVPGKNPRTFFDQSEMEFLKESIRAKGVIQPILVRPLPDGKHEIVAGERRYRAAKEVHGESYDIPVHVRELDDREAEENALIENMARANMSPTEEAESASRILAFCNGDHAEAARRLGWTQRTLETRLALMNCSDDVRQALTTRKIYIGHAELLAAIEKPMQDKALKRMLDAPVLPTVGELRGQLESIAKPLGKAIFDKADCAGCHHNSSNQRSLFGEAISDGNCTNGACYEQKTTAALEVRKTALQEEYQVVRILKAGEEGTSLPLLAEGPTGVGEEQAKACRACANFGCAISAIPGSVGKEARDVCFDGACNAKKVAARIKAEKAASEPAKAPHGAAAAKPAKKEKSAASVSAIPPRVVEYRDKLWRDICEKQLSAAGEKSMNVLLTLCLTGRVGNISGSRFKANAEKLAGKELPGEFGEVLTWIDQADFNLTDALTCSISAAAAKDMTIDTVKKVLKYLNTDLTKFWKIDQAFLDLHTKTELDVLAEELGMKSAMDGYAKSLAGKKEEHVKALMAIEGFAYEGKIPKVLMLTDD